MHHAERVAAASCGCAALLCCCTTPIASCRLSCHARTAVLAQWASSLAQLLQTWLWLRVLEPLVRLHFGRVPAAWRPADGTLREQLWHGRALAIVDAPALQRALCAPHVRCVQGSLVRLAPDGLVVRGASTSRPSSEESRKSPGRVSEESSEGRPSGAPASDASAPTSGEELELLTAEEELLTAEVIVWATGYEPDSALGCLFDERTRVRLCGGGDGARGGADHGVGGGAARGVALGAARGAARGAAVPLALYRRIVPVDAALGGLAFVGRVLSTSDVSAAFVQAEWVAAVCAGELRLPSTAERAAEAEHQLPAPRRFSAASAAHAPVAVPLVHAYLDELVAELLTARWRRRGRRRVGLRLRLGKFARGLLRYLSPLRAADYACVLR